jgi:hypothetical protein
MIQQAARQRTRASHPKHRSADWPRIAGAAARVRDDLRTLVWPRLDEALKLCSGDAKLQELLTTARDSVGAAADRLRISLKRN